MELSCHNISAWGLNKEGIITLKCPMASIIIANNLVDKLNEIAKCKLRLVALFRVTSSDKELFTTYKNVDIEPLSPDILIAVMNFKYVAMFADFGSQILPICLDLNEGNYTFAKAYSEYPWIKVPEQESIIQLMKSIDKIGLKMKFNYFVSHLSLHQADKWYSELSLEQQSELSGIQNQAGCSEWWNNKSEDEKIQIYKVVQNEYNSVDVRRPMALEQ